MLTSSTPIPALRPSRARRRVAVAVLAVASMTVAIGCAKDEVSTGGSTTTVATSKPAADAGGTGSTVRAAGTSTTEKGSTTTTEKSDGSTTTAKKSTTTTEKADGSTTTTAGSATTTTGDGPATSVVVAGDDKALCTKIAALDKEFQDLDPTKDPQAIQKIKDIFDGLVAVAPDDIKPTLEQMQAALKDVTTIEEFAKLETNPALKAASDKMTDWEKAHCGSK